MIDEGYDERGGLNNDVLPALGVMWLEAPESMTHLEGDGCCWRVIVLKELAPADPKRRPKDSRERRLASAMQATAVMAQEIVAGAVGVAGATVAAAGPVPTTCSAADM